jgi:diguanylate cyclase (GGDEF)-like protein
MLRLRILLNISLCAFAALCSAERALAADAQTIHLQLRWKHQFQFAGYYAALEKGYYAQAGLDVVLHEGSTEKNPIQEVLANHALYGVANSELLYERLHGAPLVALAAIFQHSPSVLIARKDILSPSDLIGKKVMMLGQSMDTDLLAMLSNEGVDLKNVGILPSSLDLQDFIDGRVDAYSGYVFNEVYYLKWQNLPFSILNPRLYGVDFYSDILFTSEEEVRLHPERVKAFRQATLDGWHYALSHPDEIIEWLINKYYVENSRRHLAYEARTIQPLVVQDLIDIGHMNPARWQSMAETFVNAGMVNEKTVSARLANFTYDPDFKFDKERLQAYTYFAIAVGGAFTFMFMVLLMAYKSIRRENRERHKIANVLLRQSNDLALHNYVLKKVGSCTIDLHTLHLLCEELIRGIEIQYPEMFCAILRLNPDTQQLHPCAAPSLPEFYVQSMEGLTIGEGVNCPGTAAFRGERVIIEDMLTHPFCADQIALTKVSNFRACWCVPIKNSKNEVLGVFSIYYRQPTFPQKEELISIEQYANLVMLMIERYRDDMKIQKLAFYDPLTGLPNRRLMSERLGYGIDICRRESKRMAIMMMDLDRFKAVNDNLGHLAGDTLLQHVAKRVQRRLREVDTVARLGGDEFVILLKEIVHVDDAARVAEEIIVELSRPFTVGQQDNIQIGVSIGISLYPEHGKDAEQLIDHADTALYHAKDAGRGCFAYFSEDLTRAVRERIELEMRLRHAIENKELCLYYQPQVDIVTGNIVGTEALIRWIDPDHGIVSPTQFIPLAEETGLIEEIGRWVVYEACEQGRRWMDLGITDLTIAVNVSPLQFKRSNLCELVMGALHATGFPPSRLELELTESGLMENQENVIGILNTLRSKGILLAIDDFGTGYSSLAYLKSFPLNVLKIDKRFIDDIPSLQDDMAITATIIAMGKILGFKVLAEGVETPEQLAFLKEKGCDIYQGYIKSKPLPAEHFFTLYQENRAAG